MTFTTTIDLTHAVQVVTDDRRARLGFRAECSCGWASGWTDQVGAESAGVEHREIAVGPGDGLDRLMGELLDTQDDLATVVVWLAENWSVDLPVPMLHRTGAAHTGPVKLELWAFCSDPDDVVRIGHLLGVPSIDDETPDQHGSRYRRAVAAGVGTPTVAGAYRLLRAIMATAVDDELVRRNPCRIPGADKDNSPERPVATIPEVFAIAGAMRKWYRALVLMAAFTSLRWGELIALRRRHIDLTAGFVTVRAAVTEIDSRLDVARPKSAAGVREVAIPEAIIPDLREHLRRWSEPGPNGRVFVGPKGATPRRSNFNRLWKEAGKKAGIDPEVGLRFHDLKHTGNHLTSRGASLRDVMNRMGHASTRAALIYQHADKDRERDIAAGLSQAITVALAAADRNGNGEGADVPGEVAGAVDGGVDR